MNIDLNTLTMVASVITLLQVMALFVQWRLDKTYRGSGWWLLGMAATGLGFAWAYLRAVPQWVLLAIVGNNLSFVFGRTFMYIGVLRFLGRRERRGALIAFLAVFSLVDIYFTYFNNDIVVRRAIFNLTIAVLSFLGGRAAFLYKTRAVTTSANLLSATFVLHGLVFVVSLLFNVFTPPDAGPLIASVSQLVSILGGLIATTLTTFGFILLVNQRLNAESREAHDNLELIFNTSPDAVLITRLVDGYFERINAGFTALTGYTWADVQGKSVLDIRLWSNAADRQALVAILNDRGQCDNLEAVFQRKDGSQLTGLVSARRLILQGVPHLISVTRDISDRKQAEKALAESEIKFQNLFQNAPIGLFHSVPEGRFLRVNPAIAAMLGYASPEEMVASVTNIGTQVFADATQRPQIMAVILNQDNWFQAEILLRRKDSSLVVVDLAGRRVLNADGNIAYLEGFVQDITERKRAEDALRESEEKFRFMAELLPQIVFEADLHGRLTYVNRQALGILGYPQDFAFQGLNTLDLYIPEDRARAIDNIKRRLSGQADVSNDYTMVRTDGVQINVLVYSNPILKDNRLIGLRGLIVDITQLKQTEAALRESEQRLSDVITNNVDGLLVLDQTHCIVFANPAAANLLHKPASELLNTEFGFVLTGRPIEVDLFQNQTPTILEMRAVDIVWNGAPAQLATLHDVTARKLAEEALHDLNLMLEQRVADRTAELQAANVRLTELDHLKDEFLSRISHELRTPLTSVKIYIELLETGKPEKRDKYLQTLKREADKLHALIEEVLMFSQLNLNTAPSALATIDLTALIAGRLANWQKLSAGHALEFRLSLALDLPPARADSELIIHALNRLIANAVNYTPAGSVTISTARVVEAERTWVTLSVTDTGPGITPEDLPHIFERFYRGRAAADYKTPGAGIGLSISREIAERLGGRLTVQTQIGVGSTFTLWLPASPSAG